MASRKLVLVNPAELRRAALAVITVLLLATACVQRPQVGEISRARAIELARQQITISPDRIDALKTTSDERPVWPVTLRGRLPGQPPGLFETHVVELDRRTGEVVSVARP